MIIPVNCMTCGRVIGHLWEPYSEYTRTNNALLKNNPKALHGRLARGDALDKIGLTRTCCRTAMLSHIDLTSRLRNRYQD